MDTRLKQANVGRESGEMIHRKQAVDNRTVVLSVVRRRKRISGIIHIQTSPE
jgi:hypothetical protein